MQNGRTRLRVQQYLEAYVALIQRSLETANSEGGARQRATPHLPAEAATSVGWEDSSVLRLLFTAAKAILKRRTYVYTKLTPEIGCTLVHVISIFRMLDHLAH